MQPSLCKSSSIQSSSYIYWSTQPGALQDPFTRHPGATGGLCSQVSTLQSSFSALTEANKGHQARSPHSPCKSTQQPIAESCRQGQSPIKLHQEPGMTIASAGVSGGPSSTRALVGPGKSPYTWTCRIGGRAKTRLGEATLTLLGPVIVMYRELDWE